jgi:hypothetical protein
MFIVYFVFCGKQEDTYHFRYDEKIVVNKRETRENLPCVVSRRVKKKVRGS